MAESNSTGPVDAPRIRIGDELQEGSDEFLGVIAVDTYEEGKFGLQWHLGVKPVQFSLKGETGMFSTWYKPSQRKNSKMGTALIAMMGVPEFKNAEIGFGNLMGIVAWWMRRNIEFGKKDDGTPLIAEGVLVPVRSASDAEKAEAAGGGGPAPAIAEPEYTDEQLAALIEIYADKLPRDAKKAAIGNAALSGEIKNAVMSDKALDLLLERELVVKGEGGVIRVAELAAV